MTQYVRFKVGWKDMETPEEKLGYLQMMLHYSLMVFFGVLSLIVEKGSWQSYAFLAGSFGYCFCTILFAKYVIGIYTARMDPTKDLEDYE